MTIGTTAKARVYIGSANATISELADFEADTYLEINDVIDLGEWGPEAKVLEYTRLSDAHVRRLKGSIDSGSIKMIVARNTTDAGQNKARAAVEDRPDDGEPRLVIATRREGARVAITVRDRGVGIQADDIGRVFDPYFTTRRTGTGLGLAIAKNIVEGLGGTITVSSRAGQGTVFTVDLTDAPEPRP